MHNYANRPVVPQFDFSEKGIEDRHVEYEPTMCSCRGGGGEVIQSNQFMGALFGNQKVVQSAACVIKSSTLCLLTQPLSVQDY